MTIDWEAISESATAIVQAAQELCDRHATADGAHVSYCCIFGQSSEEYSDLVGAVSSVGRLASETKTGPVFVVPPIATSSGPLRILKIRAPDKTRPEKGDADFALPDYAGFKATYLHQPGFGLIQREEFEMIELIEPGSDVRVYFSNPPVEEHSGIREALAAA